MKSLRVIAGFLLLLLPGLAHAAMPAENIALGGQDMIVLPDPATRVALGDPSIVDVKLISRNLLRLVGLKAGRTDLTVWSKARSRSFAIMVGPNVAGLQARLAAQPGLQKVTAISTPQGVILAGQAQALWRGKKQRRWRKVKPANQPTTRSRSRDHA